MVDKDVLFAKISSMNKHLDRLNNHRLKAGGFQLAD